MSAGNESNWDSVDEADDWTVHLKAGTSVSPVFAGQHTGTGAGSVQTTTPQNHQGDSRLPPDIQRLLASPVLQSREQLLDQLHSYQQGGVPTHQPVRPGVANGEYSITIKMVNGYPDLDVNQIRELYKTFAAMHDTNGLHPLVASAVTAELVNPKMVGMAHYSINTYTKGKCRGPLCRLKNRHVARLNRLRLAWKEGGEAEMDEYIKRSLAAGRTTRFSMEEINMNRLVVNMLMNQSRRIPFFLQLTIEDPLFQNRERWYNLIKYLQAPVRLQESFDEGIARLQQEGVLPEPGGMIPGTVLPLPDTSGSGTAA